MAFHRRNLANNTRDGAKLTMGIRSQVKESSYKAGGGDLFEPDLHIQTHPFPPVLSSIILFAPLQLSSQTTFLGIKILEGKFVLSCPSPQVTPMGTSAIATALLYGNRNLATVLCSMCREFYCEFKSKPINAQHY
jgi:hypothetical protein